MATEGIMNSIYNRLRQGQVRLLSASPGSHSDDLCFSFTYVVPHAALKYTAISYAWGNEPPSRQIHVDGHTLSLKPTLWACLRVICKVHTLIWADALCINQADMIERNEQVQIMDQIYRNAAVVSVWLGSVPQPGYIPVEGGVTTSEIDDPDWSESMESLASRPYWSRCWVIQEFLLAQEIHLYYEDTIVDYFNFQDMLSDKTGIELLSVQQEDIPKYSSKLKSWPALGLVMERHMDRYPDLKQGLYELLISHPDVRSTDPRDRVFALLGLLHSKERSLLARSFPDYTLTEEQVHIVTLAHIKQYNLQKLTDQVFTALCIVEHPKIHRLKRIVDLFDYIGSQNPAQEAEFLASFFLRSSETEIDSSLLLQNPNPDITTIGDERYTSHEPSPARARCKSCIKWICEIVVITSIVLIITSLNKR